MPNPPPAGPFFPAMNIRVGYADGGPPLTTAMLNALAALLVATDGQGNAQQLQSLRIGPNAWLTGGGETGLSITSNAYLDPGGSGSWYAQDWGFASYQLSLTEQGVFFAFAPANATGGPLTWQTVSHVDQNGLPVATTSPTARGVVAVDGVTVLITGQGVIYVPSGPGGFALYNDPRITGAEQQVNKGVPFGYAGLDGAGHVPLAQLPASFTPQNAFAFTGMWNAATNTPALASGVGTAGQIYIVSTAGTTALDGNATWQVNDWAYFSGGQWHRAVAAQQTPYQAPWASTARSLPSRLMEKISVCDFMTAAQLADWEAGTALVDQSSAFSAAIAAASARGAAAGAPCRLDIPPGKYLIQDTVIMQSYVDIIAYGAVLVGAIASYGYIAVGSSPTVPAASDWAGQTGGAAFADAGANGPGFPGFGLTQVSMRGGTLANFRFGFCIRCEHWNPAEIIDVGFAQVNIAVFCYLESQALQILRPRCSNVNAIFVGSATCWLAGNPYIGTGQLNDADEVVGLVIDGGAFQQNVYSNPALDTWFTSAILRPGMNSVPGHGWGGTYNFSPSTFPTTGYASGRAIALYGRSNHANQANNIQLQNLYIEFATSGYALLVCVQNFICENFNGEWLFDDRALNAGDKNVAPRTEAPFSIGACGNGRFQNVWADSYDTNDAPTCIINVLDSSGDAGETTNIQAISCNWGNYYNTNVTNYPAAFSRISECNEVWGTDVDGTPTYGWGQRLGGVVSMPAAGGGPASSDGALMVTSLGSFQRGWFDPSFSGGLFHEGYAHFRIPWSGGLNDETTAALELNPANPNTMFEIHGVVEIFLRRLDSGEMDHAVYPILIQSTGATNPILTANAIAGQPRIALNDVSQLVPGQTIALGSAPDSYVIKAVESSSNTVTCYTNLRSTYVSGSSLQPCSSVGAAQIAFQTALGGSPWIEGPAVVGSQLRIGSLLGAGTPLEVEIFVRGGGVST